MAILQNGSIITLTYKAQIGKAHAGALTKQNQATGF